jgi:hypothetical protein
MKDTHAVVPFMYYCSYQDRRSRPRNMEIEQPVSMFVWYGIIPPRSTFPLADLHDPHVIPRITSHIGHLFLEIPRDNTD